jgi:hypothetical protein
MLERAVKYTYAPFIHENMRVPESLVLTVPDESGTARKI